MADIPNELPEDVQRWTAKRRVARVVGILKGETTVVETARKHGLTVADVEEWRERFLAGAENSLRSNPKNDEALKVSHSAELNSQLEIRKNKCLQLSVVASSERMLAKRSDAMCQHRTSPEWHIGWRVIEEFAEFAAALAILNKNVEPVFATCSVRSKPA